MNFKQVMIEKLKVNVAYKVANNSSLIGEIADRVIDDLNYSEIAEELNISLFTLKNLDEETLER